MAHDYDIAVSLVLLNTFGFGPPGESWGSGTGTIPAQRIVADGAQHVRLRLSCFLSGCTNWQDIKLWVGHPDTLSPFPADPTELFLSTEWRDNTPNGPFPDFLDGYVTQMN